MWTKKGTKLDCFWLLWHFIKTILQICQKSSPFKSAFRIHLILMWIRIRILGSTFGKSGSGSGSSDPPFHNSGSGSWDPHLVKVDPKRWFLELKKKWYNAKKGLAYNKKKVSHFKKCDVHSLHVILEKGEKRKF